MAKARLGDRIKVRMSDINLAGAATIRRGRHMTVPAKIVHDRGDSWVIQLDIDVDGLDHMVVPKAAEVSAFRS